MQFEDLSKYSNCLSVPIDSITNIGWLDREFFRVGAGDESSAFLIEKLKKVVSQQGQSCYRFNQVKGFEPCRLCEKSELIKDGVLDESKLNSCEILVPNVQGDGYYASPELIAHYVEVHGYIPPQVFVDAILALDLEQPFNADSVFQGLLEN